MSTRFFTASVAAIDIRREFIRKTIHMTVAVVPLLARWNITVTMLLLTTGLFVYLISETARLAGLATGPVARITLLASRNREKGFVLGPITLCLGAMASLLIYPHPAATVAIYALAFGDGFSGLVGRIWGRHPIPVLGGKTFIGSFACFVAVFVSALGILGDPMDAFLVATAATVVEALPLGDIDNLAVPLAAGYVAATLL